MRSGFTTDQDLEALAALVREHVEAVKAGDLSTVLAGVTEDIWYFPPDAPPLMGKKSLGEALAPFYELFDIEITMTTQDIRLLGDVAFEWGTASAVMVPKAEGNTLRNPDMKYFYLYQRQDDGSWKILVDMYNSNVPPPPPS